MLLLLVWPEVITLSSFYCTRLSIVQVDLVIRAGSVTLFRTANTEFADKMKQSN